METLPLELLERIMEYLAPDAWAALPEDGGWAGPHQRCHWGHDPPTTNKFHFRGFGGLDVLVDSGALAGLRAAAGTCTAWRAAVHTAMASTVRMLAFRPDLRDMAAPHFHDKVQGSLAALVRGGMTLSCPPPLAGTESLHAQLRSMLAAPARFAGVAELHLGNHVTDDGSLRGIAELFPRLRSATLCRSTATVAGLAALVQGCRALETLVLVFVNISPADVASTANPTTLPALKAIHLLDTSVDDTPTDAELASHGLSACTACGAWFPAGSTEQGCLVHTGTYSGYGSSCSSYSCCGSMEPGYPYTPGCTLVSHTAPEVNSKSSRRRRRGLGRTPVMELYQQPFTYKLFPSGSFWLRDARETRMCVPRRKTSEIYAASEALARNIARVDIALAGLAVDAL